MRIINTFWRDVTAFGGGVVAGGLLVLTLLLDYDLFTKLFFGVLIVTGVVILIRTFYFKNRPRKEKYSNYLEKITASSFPSLHAARITVIALVLSNFFNMVSVTVLLILVTLLVCYSRIYLKKHDWKDILVGLLLGIVTWWFI